MDSSRPFSTPFSTTITLSNEQFPKNEFEVEEMKDIPYREAAEALIYLAKHARPDIAHALGVVSRYCENPGIEHWKAIKRIF